MSYQNNFYESIDINSSCFVFASAGSGKTKILVDRYVKSLFYGIKPSEILCITFTNAAVFEMKNRISDILEKLYLNQDNFTKLYLKDILKIDNINEKDIIKAESLFFEFQDSLSNLKILTIHSFCQNLLMKFPLESKIDPNFKILEENESLELLQKAKKNVFKKLVENNEDSMSISKAIKDLSSLISIYSFEDFISRISTDSSRFIHFFNINKDLEKYENYLNKKFNFIENLSFTKEQSEFLYSNFKGKNIEECFLTKSGTIRKKLPKFSSSNYIIAHEIAEILYKNNQNDKKKLVIKKTVSFLNIVKMIFDEFMNLKKEQNVIDFTDVLYITEYLLTKSLAKEFVISQISKSIKAIMIDEAQDLSNIQWNLIHLFSEDIFYDPHDINNKTIFVVGDIKQSIYRFQEADCKLFINFYEFSKNTLKNLNKNFKTIYLDTSYRTLPKILENVDEVFENISEYAFSKSSIEYKRHIPFRKNPNGTFEIININNTENPEIEIADYINSLNIDDGLILIRKRDNLSTNLISQLLKIETKNKENKKNETWAKIVSTNRLTLSENLVIMDILALLEFVIDPENSDYSISCILKSQYIFENPLTNEDLFNVSYNRIKSIFENLERVDIYKFNLLNKIIDIYKKSTLVEFFYYVIDKIICNTSENEKQIISIFMDYVIKFEEDIYYEDINEFTYYIRDKKINTSLQNDNNNNKGSIKISTIHSAKGLESKNVFILDFKLSADKSKLKFIWNDSKNNFSKKNKDQQNNENLFFIKPSKNDSFDEIEDLIDNEYLEEEKELLRLLYVAMTRPRDNLYIFGFDNDKENKTAFNLIKSKIKINNI